MRAVLCAIERTSKRPTGSSEHNGAVSKPMRDDRRKPVGVSRTIVNFWIDAGLFLVLLVVVWITFVLRFIFPPATQSQGWILWGYGYDDWSNAQFAMLALLMLGILVHLMLHWNWVCGVITSRLKSANGKPVRWEDGVRTLIGVGLILIIVNILGLLTAVAALTINAPR